SREDVADGIDVLGLVARQVIRPQFAITRDGRTITARQVVHHHLEYQRGGTIGLVLAHCLVEVLHETHGARGLAAVAGDRADAIEPYARGLVGDRRTTTCRGVRTPLRVVVDRRADVRVVDPARRIGVGRGAVHRDRRAGVVSRGRRERRAR